MKSFIAASLFAVGAFAQVSVVTDALSAIQSATAALDTAVKAYSGGSVTGLQADASAVLSAINAGNTAVAAIADLSETDAVSLITPLDSLSTEVGTTVDDVISAKSTFDANDDGYLILENLKDIDTAATTFSATVIEKVPSSLQAEASSLAAPITADLQKGISAYSGETPTSSSASSSSTVATSTSSSSVAGTSTTPSSVVGTSTTPSSAKSSTSSTAPTTASSSLKTTTTPSVGTGTGVPHPSNSTSTVLPFSGAAMPTAAAAYGAVFLAAVGAVAAF